MKQIRLTFGNTASVDITTDYQDIYGVIPATGDYVVIEWQVFSNQATNWSLRGSTKVQVS